MADYTIRTTLAEDTLGLTFSLDKTNVQRAAQVPPLVAWTKLEFLQNAIDSAMRGWQKEAQRSEFVAADIEAKFAHGTKADRDAVKLQLKNASGSNKGASGT